MFSAKLTEGIILKNFIEVLKDFASNINLELSFFGIKLQTMDNYHECMISLLLISETFEEYLYNKQMAFAISISKLSSILSNVGKEDSIILSCEEDIRKLKIELINKGKKRIIKKKIIKFFIIKNRWSKKWVI